MNAATEAAIEAARRGWHVFPCEADKTPRDGWHWDRWHTTDQAKIRQWFADSDRAGIACGPSALVVVDLDMPKPGTVLAPEWQAEPGIRDGKDVLATLCERNGQSWPATYSTTTVSGGWHLYFTAIPGRVIGNSASQVGPLIDVRGSGGYVIAYPPWDDSDLVPLPAWLADLCAPPSPSRRAAPPRAAPRNADRYVAAALEAELAAVATAWEGSRNNQLNKSAWAVARFVAAGQLDSDAAIGALTRAAAAAGLGEAETRRTLRSAFTARSACRA